MWDLGALQSHHLEFTKQSIFLPLVITLDVQSVSRCPNKIMTEEEKKEIQSRTWELTPTTTVEGIWYFGP